MRITLRQLQIFKAVAQCGKVTAAAESLFISQPAASMALSELEKHLGPLFNRHTGSSMTLNDSGRSLLPMAAELIDRAKEIESQFISGKCYNQGSLKIFASSTIGNNLMPQMLGSFKSQFPHIRIELMVDNTRNIQDRLLKMETDLAVVEGTCLHPDIQVTPWREDQLIIICSPDHRLAGKTVDLEELENESWILREQGSGTRELFDEVVAVRFREPPRIVLSLNRAEAVKQGVMSGLGIGCISHTAVWREVNAGVLAKIHVRNLTLKRYFYLLLNRRKYRSGMINQLSDFILNWKDDIALSP